MSTCELHPESDSNASRGYMPILLVLFVGSGCAALVYEIIWFQLLRLAIGSTAVSLGVLLGTFMGGMCLGSIGLPWVISPKSHPLRVYALLELGIGLIGIALLYLLPVAGQLYAEFVRPGPWGIALRGVICTVCLLPPTVLMGATLPAIARWMENSPVGIARLGFFYGANIAGAVTGCLLAGFYLLRVHDIAWATYAAATINTVIALVGLGLSVLCGYRAPAPAESTEADVSPGHPWSVYVAIGLSGLCAMGAEVIWTRILSLLLGATVYTFSIILAVFLVGLGIGSSVGSILAREAKSARIMFGWCQLLLTGAIGWTAYIVAGSLPYWPINVGLPTTVWDTFQVDIVRCLWAVLPPACLWGASFPLALAAAASREQDTGRLVGRVYAANTIGAIVGSLAFSIVMIAWVGTQRAQQILIALSALSALLMFGPVLFRPRPSRAGGESRPAADGLLGWAAIVGMVAVAAFMARRVPEVPAHLIGYGRQMLTWDTPPNYIYHDEGMNASIAISDYPFGIRYFHVSGKVVASSDAADMRLQRMLGHLPGLIHSDPKSALVVGCGAGVTAGSFVLYPNMERIVICEIEPKVPEAAEEYFGNENYHVVVDERTQVVHDDARHFIVTTKEKFDIITSDPIHPWVRGAASLYSQEYFQYCKAHLNPGGLITQWVPLYETSEEAVKSEIATFLEVFPNGTVWSNDINGSGYDIVLMAQLGPANDEDAAQPIDIEAIEKRLSEAGYARVAQSLADVRFNSAVSLLATYSGGKDDMRHWLEDATINLDRNMRLEYLAGMALNFYNENAIYQNMLRDRQFPEELFVASDDVKCSLRSAMGL